MVYQVLQEQVQVFKDENGAAQETFLWPCFSFGSFPEGLETHAYTFLGNQKVLLSSLKNTRVITRCHPSIVPRRTIHTPAREGALKALKCSSCFIHQLVQFTVYSTVHTS